MITLTTRYFRCVSNFRFCSSGNIAGLSGRRIFEGFAEVTNCNISDGPLSILQQKIADNTLIPDDHQEQVVGDLQKLYDQLKTYEPKAAPGALSKWFSFGQKKAVESELKGLYIYGSVGGGKTMLMDLFFDCCQVLIVNLFLHTSYDKFNVDLISHVSLFCFVLFLDLEEKARSF